MHGKPAQQLNQLVQSLRVDTEYVTCVVRFGRVFSGLGLLLVGVGLARWRVLQAWTRWLAVLIGVAAMALTMLWPDELWLYTPVFHVMALWLLLVGVFILHGAIATGP